MQYALEHNCEHCASVFCQNSTYILGFGRELGKEGLDGYLQVKSVYVELGDVETLF